MDTIGPSCYGDINPVIDDDRDAKRAAELQPATGRSWHAKQEATQLAAGWLTQVTTVADGQVHDAWAAA